MFNREGNLSLPVHTAAPVTGEESEVGGTEKSRLPVALSKVASMGKKGLTEIDSRHIP